MDDAKTGLYIVSARQPPIEKLALPIIIIDLPASLCSGYCGDLSVDTTVMDMSSSLIPTTTDRSFFGNACQELHPIK